MKILRRSVVTRPSAGACPHRSSGAVQRLAPTRPASMARRSSGARGAAWPVGLPGASAHARGGKQCGFEQPNGAVGVARHGAVGRKVERPACGRRPKSPCGLCAGLGTNHRWARSSLAAKVAWAAGSNTKSGTNTSPAASQNTGGNWGRARAMPPAVFPGHGQNRRAHANSAIAAGCRARWHPGAADCVRPSQAVLTSTCCYAIAQQRGDVRIQQRSALHGQQGFGGVVGQRAHALTAARGQQHGRRRGKEGVRPARNKARQSGKSRDVVAAQYPHLLPLRTCSRSPHGCAGATSGGLRRCGNSSQ